MSSDRLSTRFGALADPTQCAILARLTSGETSVKELAKPFDMSLPAISKHLKVLERTGLIARGREAQWRLVSFPNLDNTYTSRSSEQVPPTPYIRARCYRYAVPLRVCRSKMIGLKSDQYVAGNSPR
jgi:DNA-binding transcriptional ArsR family regulator